MVARLAWRNVWRNPLRSAIMVAAMVFGLLGVVLMVGFVQAMTESMVENAIRYQTAHLQVHSEAFLLNEELSAYLPEGVKVSEQLRNMEGVTGVAARQLVDGMMASAATTRGVRINGVEATDEAKVTATFDDIIEGTTLPAEGRNPVLVSRRSGDKLNLRLGSKVVLTFSDANGEVTGAAFRVCGFFKTPSTSFDDANVFVRRGDLVRFTGMDEVHELAIRLASGERLDELRPAIAALANGRGVVRDWGEVMPIVATMLDSMDISNAIVMVIFVVAMGFGIINIMLMSVFERTREFGVLMAVGMTKRRVVRLIIVESLLLGGLGGLAGTVAGVLVIAVTGHVGMPFGTMAEGMGVYGVDTVLYPKVGADIYLSMLGMILVTSLVAALFPARHILKKRPSEALAERH